MRTKGPGGFGGMSSRSTIESALTRISSISNAPEPEPAPVRMEETARVKSRKARGLSRGTASALSGLLEAEPAVDKEPMVQVAPPASDGWERPPPMEPAPVPATTVPPMIRQMVVQVITEMLPGIVNSIEESLLGSMANGSGSVAVDVAPVDYRMTLIRGEDGRVASVDCHAVKKSDV